MTKPKVTDEEIIARAAGGRAPSPIVEWLQCHYEQILGLNQSKGINWEQLAAGLREQGVLNQRGKEASAKTVKEAWNRLKKRSMATVPTAVLPDRAPRPTPPSRLNGEWHPPVVTRPIEPERPSGIPVAPSPPMIVGEASSEPQRTVADMTPRESMQEALREMDRRANRRVGIR